MQISGYPRKVRSWVWSYILSPRALIVPCAGRLRTRTARWEKDLWRWERGSRRPATAVASHPLYSYMVIGFQDGLTLLTALKADSPCLPLSSSGHSAVTMLAFALDGRRLLLGDEKPARWADLTCRRFER